MLQDTSITRGYTQKYLRQRKFFLFLPAFVLPLISFLLWYVGVIGSTQTIDNSAMKAGGLNMTLPGANTAKDSSWSKLNFYEAADKEAAKKASLARNDPYYQLSPLEDQEIIDSNLLPVSTKSKGEYNAAHQLPANSLLSHISTKDPNELKVYEKLDALNKALATENDKANLSNNSEKVPAVPKIQNNKDEVERLEAMMQQVQNTGNNSNPEMEQINSMLEKVLDIQHPERVKERLSEKLLPSSQSSLLTVVKQNDVLTVSSLQSEENVAVADTIYDQQEPREATTLNQFYSIGDDREESVATSNIIEAVIPESQTIVNGAVMKLQLKNDVNVKDILVPKGTFLYGTSSINNERLIISISSIKYLDNILPVALSVYDLDGMEGIYTPGAITRDVAKQSSDQVAQGMSLSTLDNSLGAQAATAGIQAAKTLISKKAKLVRITVSAGYEVLLRDVKQKIE
ncbi:conjugative transposon protein TraM [Pinibacter aurantiacus]|uniref:Conjugative transposon protein TraM n=1 Tax=Pinibacter aurantiacus TaxID=2851599 RepID=A0A9E2W3Y8_9BACT|nr:conjugative transposon protein TraM [Pinibacter aurantiacus]MBV4359070.1 conjugative transposon protein TraM [Pinibacter aurantiacus]